MLQVNADFAFGQVADMPKTRQNFVVLAEIFGNGFGFGWRLDDEEFSHNDADDASSLVMCQEMMY